MRSLVMQGIH